ncbi:phage holin family protein, partial [Candidatus Woesebacteria bacterium]|nr:phage holin family protein [Candidatus Woesebacteria bacterium]
MGIVISLLVNALAVAVAAYLLTPHVRLDGFMSALIVALIMALINTFVKPIITLLTLPINLLTLG